MNAVIEPMTLVPVQRLYTAIQPHHTAPVKVIATLLLTTALTVGAASRSFAEPEDLPDIGSPAQAMLSTEGGEAPVFESVQAIVRADPESAIRVFVKDEYAIVR